MSPHHPPLLFLLTYLLLLSSPLLANDIHSIPLNEWPMVMSHDAATGYLHQTLANEEVYRWTITQDRGAGGQLDCGVRGFDWRPALKKSGELVMHHGTITINYPMSSAIQEMIDWCNNNTNDEDIVVMHLSDCQGGEECKKKSLELFQELGVNGVIQDCSQLQGMTLGDALQISNLTTGGGHLLVLFDCGVNEHYWPPNGCSGFRNVTEGEERKTVEYVCYNNSDSKGFPLGRMFGYLENVGRKVAPSSGYLYQLQALWQETAWTVSIGDTYRSSLLKDEEWSDLNALVLKELPLLRNINFLEINNVCNGGLELMEALKKRVNKKEE